MPAEPDSDSIDVDLSGDGTLVLRDVTQRTVGIFGVKQSGKSHTICVFVQELADQETRYVVLDPVGAIKKKMDKGERTAPNTEVFLKTELTEDNGKEIANAIADNRTQGFGWILDMSGMTQPERVKFVDGLSERLLEVNKDPLIVIADEVHEIAPGRVLRGQALASAQYIRLVTLGRNMNIGSAVASQRLAKVSTDIRELVDVFIFHKMIYPISLKVAKELLSFHISDNNALKEKMAQIQSLGVGECLLFDPSSLNPARSRGEKEVKPEESHTGQVQTLGESTPTPQPESGGEEPQDDESEEGPGDEEDEALEEEEQEVVAQGKEEEGEGPPYKWDVLDAKPGDLLWSASDLKVAIKKEAIEMSSPDGVVLREKDANAVMDLATSLENAAREAQGEQVGGGKADADGKDWKVRVVEHEPAAAQTSMTKHGEPRDEVTIDDDFEPQDMHGLAVHEATEEMAMRKGLSQEDAHEVANAAERVAAGDYQFEAETERAEQVADKARAATGFGKAGDEEEWAGTDENDVLYQVDKTYATMPLKPANRHPPAFTTIRERVVVAAQAFLNQTPWAGSKEERFEKFERHLRELELLYGMQDNPIFLRLSSQEQSPGSGMYYADVPENGELRNTIVLPKLSAVALWHEFRHAIQQRMGIPFQAINKSIPGDPSTGSEDDARAWSLSLYYHADRDGFQRGLQRGVIFFLTRGSEGGDKTHAIAVGAAD